MEDDPNVEISDKIASAFFSQMNPSLNIGAAIYKYEEMKGRFPETPEDLLSFSKTQKGIPEIDIDDYEKLTFIHENNGSISVCVITKETEAPASISGTFTYDPKIIANHGLESTSAPPAAGTLETHP